MNDFPIPDGKEIKEVMGLEDTPVYHRKGGFKAVYRLQKSDGNQEALKAIYIPCAENEQDKLFRNQLIARAKREIRALGECASSGIVKLGSVDSTLVNLDAADYLVYSEEMLPGDALVTSVGGQGVDMDFESLRELMLTLVALIGELHRLGYLHRDIKPENIMDTGLEYRRFVILDMGIAYKMTGTNLTQGPNAPGTLPYMAPELLSPNYKESMDFRSEIYSAGLTTYVLAAKRHPFGPADRDAIRRMIMQRPAQPLRDFRSDLPVGFCNIIDRCIKKRAALRYSSLNVLEKAIRAI